MEIYQYAFDISPELPQDSDGLIEKIGKSIFSDLKKHIGIISFRGLMAWGRKEMKTVLTLTTEFNKSGHDYKFEILVKPTRALSLEAFMQNNTDSLATVSQVLNINSKQVLRKDGMVELYPGSYYSKDNINENKTGNGLSVWRGFDITVTTYNKKLYLQVDPCSRVLREENFLETLEKDKKDLSLEEMNNKYKGHPLLRKYGNPKNYRIEEIDFKLTPKKTFYDKIAGK